MPLSKRLWESDIPLLLCRSIGFLGYLRIQLKEHTIIESHPDNEVIITLFYVPKNII